MVGCDDDQRRLNNDECHMEMIPIMKMFSGSGYRAVRQMPRTELATAFYQLSRYLQVGVSLTDALDDVSSGSARSAIKHYWVHIRALVESGEPMSAALSLSGACDDSTVVAIIKAGEANGELHNACESAYQYLRWHLELRQRIATLLVYPLFSLCVLIAVAGFLLISVVPAIRGFLLSTGETLEWHTLALLGLSEWIREYYLILASVAAGVLSSVYMLLCISTGVRQRLDALILKLPLFGALLTDLLISRYAHCCAQLFRSGIALETSLQLAEETVDNGTLRAQLAVVRQQVVGGDSLAFALSKVPVVPAMFTRLVAVGERTGQLSTVLVQVGEQQRQSAEASISRLEQLVGPVLLMCIGSILMWIVISMLGPVYKLAISAVVAAS